MNLSDKIHLMKDLIKENPEITIGEYWQTIAEIESVEHKTDSLYLQTASGILGKDTIYDRYKQKAAS